MHHLLDIPGYYNSKENIAKYARNINCIGFYYTMDFSWVIIPTGYTLVKSPQNLPPRAIVCGFQNDGIGLLYAVVAHTKFGDIPTKAQFFGQATFHWNDRTYNTKNFSWIVAN